MNTQDYRGTIIEESLDSKNVLEHVQIINTKVEEVTEKHKTPWLKKWTLHVVSIPGDNAEKIANELSISLESEHNWYADFKNKTDHYIIFKNKVFKVKRINQSEYDEVKKYGISLGIPDYQLDFSATIQ